MATPDLTPIPDVPERPPANVHLEKLDMRLAKLEELVRRVLKQQSRNSYGENGASNQNSAWGRNLKVEVPPFDGTDAEFWLFKIKQIFMAAKVPFDQRVVLAVAHMTGPTCVWYKWLCPNQQLPSWDEFVEALLFIFGAIYDVSRVALKKEEQVNTVAEYLTESTSADAAFCGVEEFAEDEVIVSIEASVIDNTERLGGQKAVILDAYFLTQNGVLGSLNFSLVELINWLAEVIQNFVVDDMLGFILLIFDPEVCGNFKCISKIPCCIHSVIYFYKGYAKKNAGNKVEHNCTSTIVYFYLIVKGRINLTFKNDDSILSRLHQLLYGIHFKILLQAKKGVLSYSLDWVRNLLNGINWHQVFLRIPITSVIVATVIALRVDNSGAEMMKIDELNCVLFYYQGGFTPIIMEKAIKKDGESVFPFDPGINFFSCFRAN
ncbi:Ty3/gypsy retrotransposon protein [Senna tora]|uniref:Ty3/gypsy retrotransposon protein n=1 Tax=Senna tora TaxID=362788 RepID=A0A834XH40_9FABA|nr:Ty3/gypsy retrotransposon protein [Senna tora]